MTQVCKTAGNFFKNLLGADIFRTLHTQNKLFVKIDGKG